jgi:hypothetical protein
MFFGRRDALKTLGLSAGATFLQPIVTQLKAHASGLPVTAKRFVFVVESNGVKPQQMPPAGIIRPERAESPLNGPAEFIDVSLDGKKLPMSLEPVAAWQNKLTIVNGLSGRICGGGHSNDHGALGAVPGGRKGPSTVQETIDGALAKTVPGIFPFVGLGISKRLENNVVYSISAWDKGRLLPIICQPQQAYNTLFGSIAEGSAKQEFVAKNNVLDFLKDDLKKVDASLAAPEREQFGAYLETFETLRNRQSRLNDVQHTLREKGPVTNDKYRSAVETDRLDAQFDLAAASLICGLTNVVTISSAAGEQDFDITFTGLGFKTSRHHQGHGGGEHGLTYLETYDVTRRYHFDLIAGLCKKLEAVKEGDGTMLDNTVIVYLSDAAEAHHSRCWEWPMVVIGDMGGRLRAGRYIDYPGYAQPRHRTIANMYVTLLQLAGSSRDSFGMDDPGLKDLDQHGPLEELLS